ncbi:calcium-activated potassium channel subunit beta-3 isoform X2 [Sorex araneus]|uniref:calcium-activated potassium channel subunit beta-3 isoform X2 n=1 Tax=Sorex araneus TaxID=42254 RepID=UPI0024337775|nr:calcium-activated potassium channel subunit beta-3 isoform X2 [Sorex araneus]
MQPYSIPVQITLQGSRRRQGRTAPPTSARKGVLGPNGDTSEVHPKLPSSAGEDRAMQLGFVMMASSVLMFFLLGTTILKPFVLSTQREESNCTLLHTHITEDWMDCAFTCGMDCRGQGRYPCLQVFVKLTHSEQEVLLHYNEEALQINSKGDVIDCKVKEKQTLTVSDEHKQEVQSQVQLLARNSKTGEGA